MKYIISLLLTVGAALTLQAQNLKITQSESASKALSKIEATAPKQSPIVGYRIGIFFDNGQGARTKAIETRDKFRANFSEPVYMTYESPYYKVSCGNCLTEEEAIILFESVRKLFPNAYVMRETMDIKEFIQLPEAPKPVVDSLGSSFVE